MTPQSNRCVEVFAVSGETNLPDTATFTRQRYNETQLIQRKLIALGRAYWLVQSPPFSEARLVVDERGFAIDSKRGVGSVDGTCEKEGIAKTERRHRRQPAVNESRA